MDPMMRIAGMLNNVSPISRRVLLKRSAAVTVAVPAMASLLAESYEVATDGKKFSFVLNQGIKWQDGEAFSSADVKYNIEWYKDPANAAINAASFGAVGTVDAPDDNTVIINMTAIDAAFLTNFTAIMIVPQHVHSQTGKDNYSPKAIGTGAFKVKEWQAADHATLSRHDG